MSSTEDELEDVDTESKYRAPRPILSNKRKVQRACDNCRQKKIRCDGGKMPANRCSSCLALELECTYIRGAEKRGPPKGYIENLNNRVESIEALLHELLPDADLDVEIGLVHPDGSRPTSTRLLKPSVHGLNKDGRPDHGGSGTDNSLLLASAGGRRFFGESSSALLLSDAYDMKAQFERGLGLPEHDDQQSLKTGLDSSSPPSQPTFSPSSGAPLARPQLVFPDEDLLIVLVDLYFEQCNIVFPLLHRPSMKRNIAEGLHYEDDGFATVLLVVCAMGSRLTDDPRVFLDPKTPLSAGWKWFSQVQVVRKSLFQSPTLHDVQTYCLTAQFLTSTSAPHACWTLIGIAARLVQDIGLHRWKTFSAGVSNPLERELWKRAWWNIVIFDRNISSVAGRPCNLTEDHDVDLPERSDDQYLDNIGSSSNWRQPPGTPSRMDYFIHAIKLYRILYLTLNSMYCIDRSKISPEATEPDWEKTVVAELDAELNDWVDSMPDHLRRNPNVYTGIWHCQSVALYAQYYYLQVLLHRPLINTPDGLSFADLAVCVAAARACSHLVDLQKNPYQPICGPVQVPVFTSAAVLLLNIWGGRKSKASGDPNSDMKDVHRCMSILKVLEKKWQIAGRLWDILYELAAVGDIPLPVPAPTKKRARDGVSVSQPQSPTTGCRASAQEDQARVYASLPRGTRPSTGSSFGSMDGPQQVQQQPQAQSCHPQLPPQSPMPSRLSHPVDAAYIQPSYYHGASSYDSPDAATAPLLEWPGAPGSDLTQNHSRGSTSELSNSGMSYYEVQQYPTDPLRVSSSEELAYQTQLQPQSYHSQQHQYMPEQQSNPARHAQEVAMFDGTSMWDRAPIGQSQNGSWETFMANPSGHHLGYGYPRGQ